jgi:hypothetical protein
LKSHCKPAEPAIKEGFNMPTRLPETWLNSSENKNTSRLHPLAVGCILLLGLLHVAGSLVLQGSIENPTAALNDDVIACGKQFQRPATALPYD